MYFPDAALLVMRLVRSCRGDALHGFREFFLIRLVFVSILFSISTNRHVARPGELLLMRKFFLDKVKYFRSEAEDPFLLKKSPEKK